MHARHQLVRGSALVLAGGLGAHEGLGELELLLHVAHEGPALQAAEAAHEELWPHLARPRHRACIAVSRSLASICQACRLPTLPHACTAGNGTAALSSLGCKWLEVAALGQEHRQLCQPDPVAS